MNTFSKYQIERGDRIYVRAIQDGVTILELMVENVCDFTQLLGEIRYAGRNLEGLSRLFIRNHSRGWSCERMIKFYSGVPTPYRRALREVMREAAQTSVRRAAPRQSHMPFPWETH